MDPATYRERFTLAQQDLLVPRDSGVRYIRQQTGTYGTMATDPTEHTPTQGNERSSPPPSESDADSDASAEAHGMAAASRS